MAGPLVRHVRDDIRYVVVDEYQDTNPIQEKLIERLCRFGANLCVVGDDDQTIYQWRGSAVANILTFVERQEGVQTVTLDDNFRSSKGIVALGRDVADAERPAAAVEEHGRRRSPAVRPRRHARADLRLGQPTRRAGSATGSSGCAGCRSSMTPGAEPRGLSWSDFAVLFRSVSKDAGPLVEEMRRREIPYVIKGLTRLFDAPEVQACVTCFQYIMQEVPPRTSSTRGSLPMSG